MIKSNSFQLLRFSYFILLVISLICASPVIAVDDAKSLYVKSLLAFDDDLRAYYRKKLADKYPDSAYGLFARGWLSVDNNEEVRFYQQSLKVGHVATSYHNLANKMEANGEDHIEFRRLAMEHAIKNQDPLEDYAVYTYYNNLHHKMKSDTDKQRLYKRLQQSDRISEQLAGVQIRAEVLEAKGSFDDALKVISEEARYNTNEELINLELKLISLIGKQNHSTANEILKSMLAKRLYLVEGLGTDAPLLEYYYISIYKYAIKLSGARNLHKQLVELAFNVRNSPGLVDELYNVMAASGEIDKFKGRVDKLAEKLPDFAQLYAFEAYYYKNSDLNRQAMFDANLKAIQLAYSEERKSSYIQYAVDDAIDVGMVNQAELMLDREAKGLRNYSIYVAQLKLALLKQQFDKARKILDEATTAKINIPQFYFWMTELGESNQQDVQKYKLKHPFLSKWDNEFGGSLSLAIEFPVNSSVIPSNAYNALDKAARALKSNGADKYIFRIEGHTDSSGGNKINIPLSKQRAESVRSYLTERHGIDSGRLQAVGFGDTQPVTTNLTDDGRKHNRRVDIRPYGNISEPSIVTSGYLDTSYALYSNDGRFMASGTWPITLWDTRYGVRIRELSIGGRRSFSPNNRYLAAISKATDYRGVLANAIYVTDIKTGYLAAIIPMGPYENSAGGDLTWSPDGNRLAYTNANGILSVYNLGKKNLDSATPMSELSISGNVVWSKDGRHIITGQAQRKSIDIFDAKTLQKVKSISGTDWPHGMGLSDDGTVLLVSNNNRTLTLFDTVNWKLIDNVPLKSPVSRNIYSIPGTTKVVMDGKFNNKSIAIFDYKTRSWDLAESTKEQARVGATPDGDGIWVTGDHNAALFNRNTFNLVKGFDSSSDAALSSLYWDKSSDLLFVQDESGVNIWHVSQSRLVQRIEEKTISWVADSRDQTRWWTFTKTGELLSFSSKDFVLKRYSGVSFKPEFIKQQDNWLAVTEDVNEQGAINAKVALFNLNTQSKQTEFSVDLITEPLRFGNKVNKSGIKTLALDTNNGILALSTWWNDRFETTYSKNIQRFSLNDGSSMGKDVIIQWPIEGLDFTDMEDNEVRVSLATELLTFNLKTRKWKDVIDKDWRKFDLDNGNTLKYGSFLIEYNGTKRVVKDYIYNLQVDSERNVIITQSKSNVLTYYSLDTLEPRFYVYLKKDGEWLAADTRGYFTSSLNGTANTYWSLGDNFLPFEALHEKYENQRAVKESLAALFNGEKPIEPMPIIEPDILDVPFSVAVTSDSDLTTQEESYKLTLKITKQSKQITDPTVYYLVNGRKSRGFDSDPFADMDESLTFVRTIPLGVGENIIEAVVQYKGVDVDKKVVTVTRKDNRTAQVSKNKLWFFGVGVSEYVNSLQNLDYADRDALELERAFKSQKGNLFDDVRTKVLVNKNATARDIKIQLYDFLSQAAPEDYIVIFIAGHGVQDNNQTLYYMPHDGDMKRPFTGMAMDDFKNFLDQRPINQKALFLLDICHAGAYDNTNNGRLSSEDVIKKLTSGTATTVFSSSTGAQQSLEDERFGGGHGAFTYTILEALKGAADNTGGDGDGFVSLMEMIFYTKKEVARLTNKAQQPTVPVMNGFQDYALSRSEK
ncbi:OmpA family protein [Pseudoalteromonas lipolytica]|uniref:OmpA family protein n=1 Tax=Pseudoalteromonas lipolytica TaxID=570156 RepID=UPI003BA08E7E